MREYDRRANPMAQICTGRLLSLWSMGGSLMLSLLFLITSGCGHSPAAPKSTNYGMTAISLPSGASTDKTSSPDLTKPLNVLAWSQTGASRDPLSVSAQLAMSSGGDWLAIVPKPLDNVKWQPSFSNSYARIVKSDTGETSASPDNTISACLTAIQKSGTPCTWETDKGRVLLYWGSKEDLEGSKVHPLDHVAGLYASAHSAASLLAVVGDALQLKLRADAALLQHEDEILAARPSRANPEDTDAPQGMAGVLSSMYRGGMMGVRGGAAKTLLGANLTLKIEERCTIEQVMQRLASVLGGECRSVSGVWEFRSLTDEKKIDEEIKRLKGIVNDKGANTNTVTTTNPVSGEPTIVVSNLSEEVQTALENLLALGPKATAAFQDYLKPEKAAIAQAALRLLAASSLPGTQRMVLNFARRLQAGGPLTGEAAKTAPLLLGEIVRIFAKKPDGETCQWLAEAAHDGRVTSDLRHAARMALAANGNLALLLPVSSKQDTPIPFTHFNLSVLPNGQPSSSPAASGGSVVPMATCKAQDGSTWAVFVNGRCGNPLDFWLAHGRGTVWDEFLYTGRPFPMQNMNYNPYMNRQPASNSLSIKVNKDTITLGPPEGKSKEPTMQELQRKLANPKLTARQRQLLYTQVQALYSRRAAVLQSDLSFTLAELNKDSDHDGLTDLIEKRLFTDPNDPDTDHDGRKDGVDNNPLAATSPPDETNRLLQAVFSALFSGDPNPDPIVVVVEKSNWQEFLGTHARVLCMTKAEYIKQSNRLNAWRVLQFGGPSETGSTILQMDGPCAFNESRSRAEVHFWQWSPRQSSSQPFVWFYTMDSKTFPTDYMALFSRKGTAWRLDSIKPWRVETADTAVGEVMKKAMENGNMW